MKKSFFKRGRRAVALALSAVLACGALAGCGGRKKDESAISGAATTSKDYVYRQDDVKLADETVDPSGFMSMSKVGDRIYSVGYGYGSNGELTYDVVSFDENGGNVEKMSLPASEGSNLSTFTFDPDGSIYASLTVYAGYENPGADEETELTDTNYVVKFDKSGTELWRTQVTNPGEDTYFYIGSIVDAGSEGIIVADTSGVTKYDKETGESKGQMLSAVDSQDEYGTVAQLYGLNDGRIILGKATESDLELYELNPATGKLSAKLGNLDQYSYDGVYVGPGGDQELILTGEAGVYAMKVGKDPVMLLNFVDSDINTYGLDTLVALNETQLLTVITFDDLEESTNLVRLTKVPPEEVKDKEIISLGCYYIDSDVRTKVVEFNRASSDYRIRIVDYSQYDTEDDWWAGATKLNTDIISGNTPDILVLDSDMPVDSYIAKGLFQDLTEYFTKDEELSQMQFQDNIMELFKTDGKMYQLVPYYNVETVAGAKEDIEKLPEWTLQNLEKLAKDKGVLTENIFGPFTMDDTLSAAMDLTGAQYINWEDHTCNYDSDNFIHLLEFIAMFPAELNEEEDMADTSAYWRNGTSLLQRLYLSSFSDYNYMKKGTYGKDIVLCGFPSDDASHSGASVYPGLRLSMSASSKVKDGCWQFMRIFMSKAFQDTVDGYWPMSIEKLNALAEEAQNKPYYLDSAGNKVEYDDTWYIGDTEIIIEPMTKDEVQEVIDYLGTMDSVGSYNEGVMNIIVEEASAFFSGQKTSKEVAEIIQSRVQIYVNENS